MTRRSLILAGGGLKIAYQAGVLQVWLDEAGIEFDHADGTSAACFTLAMWAQGMSGRRIADNWRGFRPLRAIAPNPRVRDSLLSYRRIRRNVFRPWGLDWDRVRASDRDASFNVYDFTEQRAVVVPPAGMSEPMLEAAGALPVFFPPVEIDGHLWVDAVQAGAANLEHAIARGADELWIVWTTSTAGRRPRGPVGGYFAAFELAANGRLRADLDRIERSNAAVARGEPGAYGRHVEVRVLAAEVPLHYLFNYRARRFREQVDAGVRDARAWCRERGLLPVSAERADPARAG